MRLVDASTLIFFDASCLISAAISPTGGAGFLWRLCERGLLRAAVSRAVLTEASANLAVKCELACLLRHQLQLETCAPRVVPIAQGDVPPDSFPGINSKDKHVLAAALAIGADFILTLDQPLAAEIEQSGHDVLVRSPGAFIRLELPSHPSFDSLREG